MNKLYIMIVSIILFVQVSAFGTTASRLEQIYSMNYAGSLSVPGSANITTGYHYNPDFFLDLHGISTRRVSVDEMGNIHEYNTNETCETDTIFTDGLLTITISHYDSLDTYKGREIRVLDYLGRKISYENYGSGDELNYGEYIYYDSHSQPDYIQYNQGLSSEYNRRYIMSYDNFDRKTAVEVYYILNDAWVFEGRYDISYLSQFGYTLDLSYPDGPSLNSYTDYNRLLRTIFDNKWQFNDITYTPAGGSAELQPWSCVVNDSITIKYNYTVMYNETQSFTFQSDGKLKQNYFNHVEGHYGSTIYTYYTWESGVPINDPIATPHYCSLEQNYPNPFSGTTNIKYTLNEAMPVTLNIYNIKGQFVHTIFKGFMTPAEYTLEWQGTDADNHRLPSGIYLLRLKAGIETVTRKVVLLKN